MALTGPEVVTMEESSDKRCITGTYGMSIRVSLKPPTTDPLTHRSLTHQVTLKSKTRF